MLQMPAQLNSFHNCYGAGHDEREKDFCSYSAFSMGLHPCEGDAALGKVAGRSGLFLFFWCGEKHIFTSVFSPYGRILGQCAAGRGLVFFSVLE